MIKVATTESAARPFCLINKADDRYIKRGNGLIRTFRTRDEAEKAAVALNEEGCR